MQERTVRGGDRCALHPGTPAVARCASCGRTLCLSCAVPVRGEVVGPECVARALGEESSGHPDEPPVALGGGPRRLVAGIAFAVASAVTLLPWSRFGEGAGWFGAWGRPRWSMLAAVAAIVGLLLWLARRRVSALHGPGWDRILTALGALLAVGSALAGMRPPFASPAWFPPWIAAGAGLAVVFACLPLAVGRPGRVPQRS